MAVLFTNTTPITRLSIFSPKIESAAPTFSCNTTVNLGAALSKRSRPGCLGHQSTDVAGPKSSPESAPSWIKDLASIDDLSLFFFFFSSAAGGLK